MSLMPCNCKCCQDKNKTIEQLQQEVLHLSAQLNSQPAYDLKPTDIMPPPTGAHARHAMVAGENYGADFDPGPMCVHAVSTDCTYCSGLARLESVKDAAAFFSQDFDPYLIPGAIEHIGAFTDQRRWSFVKGAEWAGRKLRHLEHTLRSRDNWIETREQRIRQLEGDIEEIKAEAKHARIQLALLKGRNQ